MTDNENICKNCIYYENGKDYQPYCNCIEDNGKQYVKPTDNCKWFEHNNVVEVVS